MRPSAGAACTTASSTARPCSSSPACGSSSSSSCGSRAIAIASETRRRCPCERRPCATSGDARAARPVRARRRPSAAVRPGRLASRSEGSRARSDRRSKTSRGPRTRAPGGSRADRRRGRHRAPPRAPSAAAAVPRTGATSVVLPAPFGPVSSTTSPASTSRSAPASAGNRPSMHTADRRCTTSKSTAPGTGSETARVYERRRPGGERNGPGVGTIAGCATHDRGHRPHTGDARAADPAVRDLRAVGDGHLHGPGPDPSEERVPAGARSGAQAGQPGGHRPPEQAGQAAPGHHHDHQSRSCWSPRPRAIRWA